MSCYYIDKDIFNILTTNNINTIRYKKTDGYLDFNILYKEYIKNLLIKISK